MLAWTALALLAVLAAAFGTSLLVLAHLDYPPIAGWLQRTARDAGMELTYDELAIHPFSGLHAANLRIRTPAAYAAHAPDLVALDRIDIDWAFWPLLAGEVRVSRFELAGMRLAQVTDETGKTSVDALLEAMGIPEDTAPLSRSLQDLPVLSVASLSIGEVAVELVDIAAGAAVARTTIAGLCVSGPMATSSAGLDADLRLAPCVQQGDDAGVRVVLASPDSLAPRELVLDLQGTLTTPDAQRIAIALEGDLVRQSLLPDAALPRALVRAQIDVAFDAAAQQTHVRVPALALLGETVTAEVTADLRDRPGGTVAPVIHSAAGTIDLGRALALAPAAASGSDIELTDARMTYAIEQLAVDPATGLVEGGQVRIDARIPGARIAMNGDTMRIDDASLRVDGRLGAPGDSSTLHAELRLAGLDSQTSSGERVSLAGFQVTVDGKDVQVDLDTPLASRGTLALDLALDRVDTAMSGQTTAVRGLRLQSEVRTDAAGVIATASLPITSIELRQPGQSLTVKEVRADVRATVRDPVHFDMTITVPWDDIAVRGAGGLALSLGAGNVGITAADMALNAADPAQSQGRIRVTSSLPRADVRTPEMDAAVRDLALTLDAVLAGARPPTLAGSLPIGRLDIRDRKRGQRLARVAGGKLAWQVNNLVIHAEDPLRTTAEIAVEAALPSVSLPTAGTGGAEFALPEIKAALALGRQVYDANVRLVLAGVKVDGKRHDARLVTTVHARAALRKPGIDIDVAVRGAEGPELGARLAAHYQRDRRSLVYDLGLVAERLEAIEALLPAEVREAHQLDWKALRLEVKGEGEVREVIRRFRKDLTPVLADDPLLALRGEQTLTVDLTGLDYRAPDQAVQVPQLAIRFHGSRDEGPIIANLDITSPNIHIDSAGAPIDIVGLAHHVGLSSVGPPERSRVEMQLTTEVERVEQEFIGYPVAKARLVARGHIDRLLSLRVEELRFDNPAGGTRLEARAAVDRVSVSGRVPAGAALPDRDNDDDDALTMPGRQALSLSGTLRQTLDTVSLGKGAPRMRGKVALPFRVESGDLSAFRVAAQLQLEDVHVALPREGIAVEDFDGVIPVAVDLALSPGGDVILLGGPGKNLYSRTRFLDVHPFLRDRHYLTVKRITAMGETIGPLAGNLRVERDTVALDQLQLGYRGGNIAGQLLVDYRNGSPSVQFRGNITGVRPGSGKGEVLDANAAITFIPDKLDLEGRIQMVRISRAHLIEVLDVIDPYRENVDINRVRLGLEVGYPKFVRLVMNDGFLAVKIELGGVASLVRIGEIRGVALGPLMNIYVAPVMAPGAGATP